MDNNELTILVKRLAEIVAQQGENQSKQLKMLGANIAVLTSALQTLIRAHSDKELLRQTWNADISRMWATSASADASALSEDMRRIQILLEQAFED